MHSYNVVGLLNKEIILILRDGSNLPIDATILNVCDPFVWVRYKVEPDTVRVVPIHMIYCIKVKE